MPITPPQVKLLLQAYDEATNLASELTKVAADVAPAAVGEVLCSVGGAASLGAGPFGEFQGPGTPNRFLSDIGGILQAACPVPPPLPVPAPPPFGGGQCDDKRYLVNLGRIINGTLVSGPIRASWGPVAPIRIETDEFGVNRYYFDQRPTQGGPVTPFLLATELLVEDEKGVIVSTATDDGSSDVCGDPAPPPFIRPPIVQPPPSAPIPTTEPDGSPGDPVVITPRVGPIYIDVDATVKVPVTIEVTGPSITNNVTIPVSVSLPDFEVNFEYGGGGGTDPVAGGDEEPYPPAPICCPPPDPVVEDGPEEDPEEDPPEPDETKRIVGVVVTSEPNGDLRRTTELGNPLPDLHVPRLATVQFEIRVGDSVAYSTPYDVKNRRQYLPAPTGAEATRAFLGFEPGWTGKIEYVLEKVNPRREE